MCHLHLPDPDQRCAGCEADFAGERPPLAWRLVRAVPAGLAGALVGGIVLIPSLILGPTLGFACLFAGAGLGAGAGGNLFDRWRERTRRLRFLREPDLPQARALPAPDSPD